MVDIDLKKIVDDAAKADKTEETSKEKREEALKEKRAELRKAVKTVFEER